MLRYELESRGDMDGTDDSSNYHYCKFNIFKINIIEAFKCELLLAILNLTRH